MADNRIDTVEKVLADAIARQAASTPKELDCRVIATEIVAALGRPVAANPLDPEGDGLEADEINAANDL